MEINAKQILKELGIATGLGVVSYFLGGSFGDVFVLYLVLSYLLKRD